VCTHVSDARSLARRFRGGRGRRTARFACGSAPDEAAADFLCGAELTPTEGPRSGDRVTRALIRGGFRFEDVQNSFCTVRRPGRNDTSISFAQGLR
jgi:hypothetical protein